MKKHLIFATICCLCSIVCFKRYFDLNNFFSFIGGICWLISGIFEFDEYLYKKDDN